MPPGMFCSLLSLSGEHFLNLMHLRTISFSGEDRLASNTFEETHSNPFQVPCLTWRPPITRHDVMQALKGDKQISSQEVHAALEDIYNARYEPGSSCLLPKAWRHIPSDTVTRIWWETSKIYFTACMSLACTFLHTCIKRTSHK